MKLIIRDHLRRWGWLSLVIGIFNCFIAGAGDQFALRMVLFFIFWLGAMQLNFDLQRGAGRVQTTLPVTVKQVGQAWWIFSVALPALILAVTTGLGLWLQVTMNGAVFPWGEFGLTVITNTVFLGTLFFLIAGTIPAWPHDLFGWLRYGFYTALIWGMVFYKPTVETPAGIAFLLVGFVSTVAGWFQAEQIVMRRAAYKPGVELGKRKPGRHQAPVGFGGLPFLWGTLFIRAARFALVFVVYMIVIQVVGHGGSKLSPMQLVEASLPALSSFGYLFVYMFLAMPMLMQLRLLRTLPISASALAAMLVLLPTLPILLLGLVWLAVSGGVANGGNVFLISLNFLTSAAMLAIGVPIFVWQGLKFGSYVLVMVLMMVSTLGPILFQTAKISPTLITLVSLGLIALAFELTRRLLSSSSQAYRPPPATLTGWGGAGWGGWR